MKVGKNWKFTINNQTLSLLTGYENNPVLNGIKIVMPYLEDPNAIELSKGAFRMKF